MLGWMRSNARPTLRSRTTCGWSLPNFGKEVEIDLLENAKDPVEDALSLLGSAGIRDAVQRLALDPQAIDAAEADELLTALQFTAEVMSSLKRRP